MSKEKPSWIAEWPKDYQERFSPNLRRSIQRGAGRIRMQNLTWNDSMLYGHFDGKFDTRWMKTPRGWKNSCSCGYPDSLCGHSFFLALSFQKLAQNNGWLEGATPLTTASIPQSSMPSNIRQRLQNTAQRPSPAPQSGPQQLLVEVDTSRGAAEFLIRFYQVQNAVRSLFKIQALMRQTSGVICNRNDSWNEQDSQFLRWLHPHINKKHVYQNNLSVFKITEKKFASWVKHWQDEPQRFIEKDSQKAYTGGITAGLMFELETQGDKTYIHCFVGSGEKNRQAFHQVYQSIQRGSQIVVNDSLYKFHSAVNMQTVMECFSKKSPSLPSDKVCSVLPSLLENHLELLCGPQVEQVSKKQDLSVYAQSTPQGISLSPRIGKKFLDPKAQDLEATMTRTKTGFKVSSSQHEARPLFLEFIQNFSYSINGDRIIINCNRESLKRFSAHWSDLPETIIKSCDQELQDLLDQKALKIETSFSLRQNEQYLDYNFSWQNGNTSLTQSDLEAAARSKDSLIRSQSGNWLYIDADDAQKALGQFEELGLAKSHDRVFAFDAPRLLEASENIPDLRLHRDCQKLATEIRQKSENEKLQISDSFHAILRDYQKEGVEFMLQRLQYEVGVILADDMGLGKTVQTLATIDALRQTQKDSAPSLVVTPASVLYVWKKEAEKFLPQLRVKVLSGNKAQRRKILKNKENYDLLVCSYGLVRNDIDELEQQNFFFSVLDEAHHIKNPKAHVSRATKRLKAQHRLALSGTPIENKLTDLWSLMDFLNPGYLGTLDRFENYYGQSKRKELSHKVTPLLLRRNKKDVLTELPPKTEEILYCDLLPEQEKTYNKALKQARNEVSQSSQGLQIFAALTRLRQICCDSRLHYKDGLPLDYPRSEVSAKLNALKELLSNIQAEGSSVLIFSQFTSMLDLVEKELSGTIKQFRIDGSTSISKRPQIVDEFNDSKDSSAFLLSLKAAGTGLTLTKADYVILFDPWWNPAAEQQAIDRCHRIGQENPVFVYRLVTRNTIEEKIIHLQNEKLAMISDVLDDEREIAQALSKEDLANLLSDH